MGLEEEWKRTYKFNFSVVHRTLLIEASIPI
jgi:hypothetical protein